MLMMINKKRGYKSSRKVKKDRRWTVLIDGMDIARKLYDQDLASGATLFAAS